MKTLESVPVHSAAKFTWNQGQATAERSSFGRTPLDGRVWADSMDTGFYMVSPNTGAKKLFLLMSERRDSDGVLLAEIYLESPPGDAPITVTVFND